MSGHSKWSKIKRQKGVSDQKKGQLFSRLARTITLAAKRGADPSDNPQLQSAIERARGYNMPKDNIERAIKRASEKAGAALEEITVQAIGPEGVGIVIKAITDNKNRTMAEIRTILGQHPTKLVPPGSLNWLFDRDWHATQTIIPDATTREQLAKLFEQLADQAEVEDIYSNAL